MPWDQVMHKWKTGKLKSGSGGKVTNQKQAVAIMLSEKKKMKIHSEYKPKKMRVK